MLLGLLYHPPCDRHRPGKDRQRLPLPGPPLRGQTAGARNSSPTPCWASNILWGRPVQLETSEAVRAEPAGRTVGPARHAHAPQRGAPGAGAEVAAGALHHAGPQTHTGRSLMPMDQPTRPDRCMRRATPTPYGGAGRPEPRRGHTGAAAAHPLRRFSEGAGGQRRRCVMRNIFQVFHDMVKSYVGEGVDEYPDDPESIHYAYYDCNRLFVDDVGPPLLRRPHLCQPPGEPGGVHEARAPSRTRSTSSDGPPGCGKSTFLNNLLRKFEEYTNTDAGLRYEAVWRFDRRQVRRPCRTSDDHPVIERLSRLLGSFEHGEADAAPACEPTERRAGAVEESRLGRRPHRRDPLPEPRQPPADDPQGPSPGLPRRPVQERRVQIEAGDRKGVRMGLQGPPLHHLQLALRCAALPAEKPPEGSRDACTPALTGSTAGWAKGSASSAPATNRCGSRSSTNPMLQKQHQPHPEGQPPGANTCSRSTPRPTTASTP